VGTFHDVVEVRIPKVRTKQTLNPTWENPAREKGENLEKGRRPVLMGEKRSGNKPGPKCEVGTKGKGKFSQTWSDGSALGRRFNPNAGGDPAQLRKKRKTSLEIGGKNA